MARAVLPSLDVPAPPRRPRYGKPPYDLELIPWGNLLANLWALRSLYLARAQGDKLKRFDLLLSQVKNDGTRILPHYREKLHGRGFYLCENVIIPAGRESLCQEAGWWLGALVAAFELARAYGLILPENDRRALATARIWQETLATAYRSAPEDLVDAMRLQVTGGRGGAPANLWDLVRAQLVGK